MYFSKGASWVNVFCDFILLGNERYPGVGVPESLTRLKVNPETHTWAPCDTIDTPPLNILLLPLSFTATKVNAAA